MIPFARLCGSCFGTSRLSTRNSAFAVFSNRSNAESSGCSSGRGSLLMTAMIRRSSFEVEQVSYGDSLAKDTRASLSQQHHDSPRWLHRAIPQPIDVLPGHERIPVQIHRTDAMSAEERFEPSHDLTIYWVAIPQDSVRF